MHWGRVCFPLGLYAVLTGSKPSLHLLAESLLPSTLNPSHFCFPPLLHSAVASPAKMADITIHHYYSFSAYLQPGCCHLRCDILKTIPARGSLPPKKRDSQKIRCIGETQKKSLVEFFFKCDMDFTDSSFVGIMEKMNC